MKILILCVNKSEEIETIVPFDLLKRNEFEVDLVSMENTKELIFSLGTKITVNKLINEINYKEYDVLIIPGGTGYKTIDEHKLIDEIIEHFNNKKVIGAICAAPTILAKRNILKNKKATCYYGVRDVLIKNDCEFIDEQIVTYDNIVTARNATAAIYFANALIYKLKGKEKLIEFLDKEHWCENCINDTIKKIENYTFSKYRD